jgi:GT2 family glycosyltransferase
MTRPSISVITVNYNGGALIMDCVRSLWPQLQIGDEVFVIDNASTDGSLERLEEAFAGLKIIRNRRNLGEVAANNQALSQASSTYNLLLDPDTVLEPDALATALD